MPEGLMRIPATHALFSTVTIGSSSWIRSMWRWMWRREGCGGPLKTADSLRELPPQNGELPNKRTAAIRGELQGEGRAGGATRVQGDQATVTPRKVHPNRVSTWTQREVEAIRTRDVFSKGANQNPLARAKRKRVAGPNPADVDAMMRYIRNSKPGGNYSKRGTGDDEPG